MYEDDNPFCKYLIDNNLIKDSRFDMICISTIKFNENLPKNKFYYYIKYIIRYYQTGKIKYLKKYFINIDFNFFRTIYQIHVFNNYHLLAYYYHVGKKNNKLNYYLKKGILFTYSLIGNNLLKNYSYLIYKQSKYIKYFKKIDYLLFILKKL